MDSSHQASVLGGNLLLQLWHKARARRTINCTLPYRIELSVLNVIGLIRDQW